MAIKPSEADGPVYRLTADAYAKDQLLQAGTVVGAGTAFPWVDPDGKPVPPNRAMEPLNDAAKAEIDKLGAARGNPVDSLPINP